MREGVYTSREVIKKAVDVSDSARANAQIDRLIEDSSRSVDRLCHRTFYPWTGTVTFDWPDIQSPTAWRFWLYGKRDLYSLTAITSGGVSIDTANVLLYPSDGPPYDRLEIDQSGSITLESGSTDQGSLSLTGLWTYDLDERSVTTISATIDASTTSIGVADGSALGVGDTARCGTERMIVVEKRAAATGYTLSTNLGGEMRNTTVSLTGAGTLHPNEMILIDGERMLVADVVGTTAIVSRQQDGTVLAAHTAGATVYAYRTLTVERAALGTTAAGHTAGDALLRFIPPAPVEGLTIAKTLTALAQENSSYARVIGSGENQREARGAGLAAKIREVYDGYAKRLRQGVI